MNDWIGRQYYRIRKRRCPHDIADPGEGALTFNEVEAPYKASADVVGDPKLTENLPVLAVNHHSDRFVGLFGRVVKSDSMSCYQYLWVWDGQLFPIHAMDYAPAMVYANLGEGVRRFVYYDFIHYRDKWIDLEPNQYVKFLLNPLWHSFLIPLRTYDRRNADEPELRPLCDSRLNRWWGKDGILDQWYARLGDPTPRLKIEPNLRNPMRMLLPTTAGFDRASPSKIPTLERAAMWVRDFFIVSASVASHLSDCVGIMREMIKPAVSSDSDFARRALVGLASYMILLQTYGEIHLTGSERTLHKLFVLVDESKPTSLNRDSRAFQSKDFLKQVLESKIEQSESDYFTEVKTAIEEDRKEHVLEDEVARWYKSSKRRVTSGYHGILYDHITRSELLRNESIEK